MCEVILISDSYIGHERFDKKRFDELMKKIKETPANLLLSAGDMLEMPRRKKNEI